MARDAGLEIQRTVRALLVADTTLAGLMGGSAVVYDHVPQDTARPYIQLRATQAQEWDTDPYAEATGIGEAHILSLDTWSDYEGVYQTRQLLRRCKELISDQEASFTLIDHKLISIRFVLMDVFPEPDGQLYHGVVQFRAITEET